VALVALYRAFTTLAVTDRPLSIAKPGDWTDWAIILDAFDISIQTFVTSFAHRSTAFDMFVSRLDGDTFWKGGPVIAALWWCWFRSESHRHAARRLVIGTIASAVAAVILGRALAIILPFRVRPIFEPSLQGILNFASGPTDGLQLWSSFPSDHAMAFSAVATGLWLVSRPMGLAAFAYVVAFIDLPRIYVGLHYPTDILGGTVFGIVVTLLVCSKPMLAHWGTVLQWIDTRWVSRSPGLFYPFAFFLTFEMSTMFNDVRFMLMFVAKLLPRTLH